MPNPKKYLAALLHRASHADIEDDQEFRSILSEAMKRLSLSDDDIAGALLVSRPTVNRWLEGKSEPHPAMRRPIYAWIIKLVQKQIQVPDRR